MNPNCNNLLHLTSSQGLTRGSQDSVPTPSPTYTQQPRPHRHVFAFPPFALKEICVNPRNLRIDPRLGWNLALLQVRLP